MLSRHGCPRVGGSALAGWSRPVRAWTGEPKGSKSDAIEMAIAMVIGMAMAIAMVFEIAVMLDIEVVATADVVTTMVVAMSRVAQGWHLLVTRL